MARHHENHHQKPTQIDVTTTTFRWPTRRGIGIRARRKLPIIRLGGKKSRRGPFLMRILRRMRLKCLKSHSSRMLRRLKEYYRNLIKDFIEAGPTLEAYQQRLLMETSFAVPVGISFASFPSMP